MKLITKTIYSTLLTLLLSNNLFAECSYELFSISSTKDTKIIDFVEHLSNECDLSIIITDPYANKFLDTELNRTNLNNLTITEVLDIILKENNLSYTLKNNLLRISYLTTKMFEIDYILSQRKSTGSTDITLSSQSQGGQMGGAGGQAGGQAGGAAGQAGGAGGQAGGQMGGGGSTAQSGSKIESTDEVEFWKELDIELQRVLNRPQDIYEAGAPIINKNAGIITVTATIKQMQRLEKYLKKLQDKVQLQVLIDVKLLSVSLSKGKSTGIDWSQLYALQNMQLNYDFVAKNNVVSGESGGDLTLGNEAKSNGNLIRLTGSGSLNQVIKFLSTQGDVTSISNPKVLTLNNQAALITAGTEYFYKITSTETLAGGTSGAQSENELIQSVFAGVLLDITPEISDDQTITLKINPSLSETAEDISETSSEDRTMPPDLNRRQLASVVTVKDGNRIVLGGLINTKHYINENKVPILGDIPIFNYLFKYEEKIKQVQELVIVIEPHIINKDKNNVSLADLGYENMVDSAVMNNTFSISEQASKLFKSPIQDKNKKEKDAK